MNMEQAPSSTDLASAAARPVAEASRVRALDMLRGVALLGILLINIPFFSMPEYFSESFRSNPASGNFWLWALMGIFVEGKMRALFGMVFGAGVFLFAMKKEQTGKPVHGLFYRRMGWLVVFGLIHAHLLLWSGDILFFYGMYGMVVYLCRNLRPAILVLFVPMVALFDFTANTLFYRNLRATRLAYVGAMRAQSERLPLTEAQAKAVNDWREIEKTLIPNREDVKENTRRMKSDYAGVASRVRPQAFMYETKFLILGLPDSLALMLLGVALYKWGFLTGSWPRASYSKIALIGYGIGLPLVIFSTYHGIVYTPNLEANLRYMEEVPVPWVGAIYPFQRILLVMAHIAILIQIYLSGFAQNLMHRLERIGQMAFTNYVMQSVICTLFFFGYGFNKFAELQFYQIYLVVLAIWIFQLVVSPLWLRYFLFGPLEWSWRSLTYWHIQPMKRKPAPAMAA